MSLQTDVVVINYRTPQLMRECVRSLDECLPEANLILVDNSESGPGTPPYYGGWVIPNLGYGNACNYGARKGTAEYILFLNADTAATDQINLPVIEELFNEPQIAIVGPKQVSPEGWIASAGCPYANNGVGYYIRGWRERDVGQYREKVLDCQYVPGSVLWCRRSVWEQVGGLLEKPGEFSQYYEDLFLCYAARHYGHRVVYCGESVWIHHWDASPKPQKEQLTGRDWVAPAYQYCMERLRAIGVQEQQLPTLV